MLTGPNVILALKIGVSVVTVLLAASLVALARGKIRLHGRINLIFFVMTLVTLVGFELLIQVIKPELFEYIRNNPDLRRKLIIHLCFSVPSALLLPAMLYTGWKRKRKIHLTLACIFLPLWIGTLVTGIFFLH